MPTFAPRQTRQSRNRPANRVSTLCVVDPQADDYQGWDAMAQENGVQLKVVPSAEEALRLAHNQVVDLWVVNTQLPGLSGCELCRMLRAGSTPAPVYLVADEYSPTAELAALQSQATLFGCKPGHQNWLGASIGQLSCKSAQQPTAAASDLAPVAA